MLEAKIWRNRERRAEKLEICSLHLKTKERELFEGKCRTKKKFLRSRNSANQHRKKSKRTEKLLNNSDKYKAALEEIEDIKKENQSQDEDSLITTRSQASEREFFKELVKILLKPEEISRIKAKSSH